MLVDTMDTKPPSGQRGHALGEMLAEWAAGNPKIRRVWVFGDHACDAPGPDGDIDIAVELQPVADSEETLVAWMANSARWHHQLQVRTGRNVNLSWLDPDGPGSRMTQAGAEKAKVLLYERAS